MNYINYYNGENSVFSFSFDGFTKEESERIQAYFLKENTLFIEDEDALKKIGKEPIKLYKCEPYTEGEIFIERSKNNKEHYLLCGYKKIVKGNKEKVYSIKTNIYEGLNFIAFVNMFENIKTNCSVFSSFNWVYEKSYNPNTLLRFDIKDGFIGSSEPTYKISEYETIGEFNIKENPKEIFDKNKKEVKIKKI